MSSEIWQRKSLQNGAIRKRVFRHTRTVKVKISLRIGAFWSGPSLSANNIIGYYRMVNRLED